MTDSNAERVRLRIEVRGAVQGVGFRPFVYRLAHELALTGWVNNSPQGAAVEVEGDAARIAEFLRRLPIEKPPPCVLHSLTPAYLPPVGFSVFEVRASSEDGPKTAVILPDLATCADCLRDIFDPNNRRFRYPFTNCTNCGPRFSIIEDLPYDRPRTTMKRFPMCDACRAEYDDPADRRFHAQPNACPQCGPHLELWDASGAVLGLHDEALRKAAEALRRGDIVAAKGLGGFHLLVDAGNQDAVLRLRRRKRREEKPFGLMYPNLESVQRDCRVSEEEMQLLCSPESPLVLLRRSRSGEPSRTTSVPLGSRHLPIAAAVAPGNPHLGVMLPYTPLHHLLLAELNFPIVATSGNCTDEPICLDEREALTRLADIADVFLVHDRPIARQVDDSVVRVVLGREMMLRRARGYAPFPVAVSETLPTLLAVGAQQKNTLAFAAGRQVVVSQHVGDLDTPLAVEAFRRVAGDLPRLYELQPQAVVCDLHPEYHSTRHAETMGLPVVRVQHHHAHIRACMAEHGLTGPLLGVAWDGTGLGLDDTIWGGEFLHISSTGETPVPPNTQTGETPVPPNGFERVAHLRTFRLPGGERAVREPRRTALGLLYELFGDELFARDPAADAAGSPLRSFTDVERGLLRAMLRSGFNSPRTSSAGRLFDGVAALLGIRQTVGFEGQAAMELEFAVPLTLPSPPEGGEGWFVSPSPPSGGEGWGEGDLYPFTLADDNVVDWGPMVQAILDDIRRGAATSDIARRFHDTLAEMILATARRVGEKIVVLSGGCFQNAYLLEQTVTRLDADGFRVYWPQRIPPNDGGIALGQIMAVASDKGSLQ